MAELGFTYLIFCMQIAIHPKPSEYIDIHAMLQYGNVAKGEKAHS